MGSTLDRAKESRQVGQHHASALRIVGVSGVKWADFKLKRDRVQFERGKFPAWYGTVTNAYSKTGAWSRALSNFHPRLNHLHRSKERALEGDRVSRSQDISGKRISFDLFSEKLIIPRSSARNSLPLTYITLIHREKLEWLWRPLSKKIETPFNRIYLIWKISFRFREMIICNRSRIIKLPVSKHLYNRGKTSSKLEARNNREEILG